MEASSYFFMLVIIFIIQSGVNFYYMQKKELREFEIHQKKKEALEGVKRAAKAFEDNYTFEVVENEED